MINIIIECTVFFYQLTKSAGMHCGPEIPTSPNEKQKKKPQRKATSLITVSLVLVYSYMLKDIAAQKLVCAETNGC